MSPRNLVFIVFEVKVLFYFRVSRDRVYLPNGNDYRLGRGRVQRLPSFSHTFSKLLVSVLITNAESGI